MDFIRTLAGFAIISTFVCNVSFAIADEQPAPLGLNWGMSSSKVEAQSIVLKPSDSKEFGISFNATKLQKVISDAANVNLAFGFDDKLWRIVITSRPFENDPYGRAVLSRYEELVSILAEKYGKGDQYHWTGDQFYSKPENFVYAISGGNGWWYTNFSTPDVWVQLSIRAWTSSSAIYSIIFENNSLRASFEKTKSKNEKDSL